MGRSRQAGLQSDRQRDRRSQASLNDYTMVAEA